MPISQMILPEFDHEMANTRKTLERVPDDKFAWKPHEKSMSLGGLSTHLANIPSWTAQTFDRDELDISPPGTELYRLGIFEVSEREAGESSFTQTRRIA